MWSTFVIVISFHYSDHYIHVTKFEKSFSLILNFDCGWAKLILALACHNYFFLVLLWHFAEILTHKIIPFKYKEFLFIARLTVLIKGRRHLNLQTNKIYRRSKIFARDGRMQDRLNVLKSCKEHVWLWPYETPGIVSSGLYDITIVCGPIIIWVSKNIF